MSFLFKIGIPCAGCVTAGGSLIGSNYLFSKTIFQDLDKNDKKWEEKLDKLLKLIETNNNLKEKINTGGTSSDNLAITTASENTAKSFTHKERAKADLKTWCAKKDKEETEKQHENNLCKKSKSVGWLFGK